MLSRHAEDLFWTGRYIERADDTARILDVTYHGLVESPQRGAADPWRELLEVLYLGEVYEGDSTDAGAVTDFLVLDRDNPGSVLAAIGRARDNARGLRDQITTELWEAINTFYLELGDRDLPAELELQPYPVYRWVRNQCQMIAGVAAETMLRTDGYRFWTLGRMLERAEMTCRLLAVRYQRLGGRGVPVAFHWWVSLLKSVAAFEAYLKSHDAGMEPERVLEFLLLAPDFPRSVLYCLRATEAELGVLAAGDDRIPAQRLLGRVRARVEYGDIDEIVAAGLVPFLDELQTDIWRVADAIDRHFFKPGADLDLHAYEST